MSAGGRLLSALAQAVCARPPCAALLCWRGPRRAGRVALTFDDGPNAHTTPRVLEALRRLDVKATFFVLGREAEREPGLLRALAEAGHEVGLHSYDHTAAGTVRQLRQCERLLAAAGLRTRLFRPPLGRLPPSQWLPAVVRGYRVVLWSFDAHDSMRDEGKWTGPPPDYAALRGGDIVLMHDDNDVCVRELPALVAAARARGLRPGSVGELLGAARRAAVGAGGVTA